MKSILAAAAILTLLAPSAFAQSPTAQNQSGTGVQANPNSSSRDSSAVQKIEQDLQSAGFKDVKVLAESFVVQAKSKDGDPVLMTIGPHGMSVFEAINNNTSGAGSSSNTTGSSGTSSNSGAQK